MDNTKYKDNDIKFWIIEENENDTVVKIDQMLLLNFLMQKGFNKMYLDKNSIFIKIEDNIISEVSIEQIKDYVLKYVREAPYPLSLKVQNSQIVTALVRGNNVYFSKSLLQCIEAIKPDIKKDKLYSAYYYFQNCFVKVSVEDIEILPYSKLDHLVWKDQINNRSFSINETISDFEPFLKNVCYNDIVRFNSLYSSIGYLLHSYKDPTITKAVIYCDESLDTEPKGRTGKSRVAEAISKLKKTAWIDGKDFNFNQRFTYQQVDLDTQVINFNDVKSNFNFEALFSVLTDGITVEKKSQKPFSISFKDSPKILISTNYSISGEGDSFQDRMFEVEFGNYYNADHKPIDDFGKRFWDDWNNSEWNSFFTFMLKSVQYYLRNGLVYYKHINLDRKKLEQATKKEFCLFADSIEINKEYDKKELFESFVASYPEFHFMQRTFDSYLKLYSSYNNITLSERKSAGRQYVKFCQTKSE